MQLVDGKKVFSPTEVNYFAKIRLEDMDFWVEGEVSECEQISTYSFYKLSIKDNKAILPCVVSGDILKVNPADLVGKKVLIYGNLTLWEARGWYQFRIYQLSESGAGIFQKNLDELIKKLLAEGLFDEKHKKPIPEFPAKICLVTSAGSAAFTDFKRHSADKFPILQLYTADVRVQGANSIPNLLKVLPLVDEKRFDVVVITRGGGSLEDLAAFNSEDVARTIFKMKTPTIVAIGHEHNQSLAEWVADKRASTPTDAANIVVSGYQNIVEKLEGYNRYLRSKLDHTLFTNIQSLSFLYNKLLSTKDLFIKLPSNLDQFRQLMQKGIENQLNKNKQKLEAINISLRLLSPENTLSRGYAIATGDNGRVIRSVASVVVGARLGVKLSDGSIASRVLSKTKNDKSN